MIYYSVYYILFTIQQPRHIWPCDRFSRAMKTAQMAIAGTISSKVCASQVFTKLLKRVKFSSDQKIVREGFFRAR